MAHARTRLEQQQLEQVVMENVSFIDVDVD
jgi:hypothetical protein